MVILNLKKKIGAIISVIAELRMSRLMLLTHDFLVIDQGIESSDHQAGFEVHLLYGRF